MPNTRLDDPVVAAPGSFVARHPVAVLLTVGIAFVWITQLGSLLAGVDVMPAKIAELVVLLGGATWISYRVGGRSEIRRLYAGLTRWRLGWRYRCWCWRCRCSRSQWCSLPAPCTLPQRAGGQ
jgi:hypothetical protein